MYPTQATARPIDPLADKAIAARIENPLEDYAHRMIPAVVVEHGSVTFQRVKDGELNRLNPAELEAWLGGNVEMIDGAKLDPYAVNCEAFMRAASVGMLGASRAQNANLLALKSYMLAQLMLGKRELNLGTLLGTAASWHSDSGALAAGQKWTTSGGDPLKLLYEMLDAVGGRDVFMTRGAYNAFVKNSKVLSDRPTTVDRGVLNPDEVGELLDRKYGARLIVSRARYHNGTKHTPIISDNFVWVGNLSEMPTQVGIAPNNFQATQAAVVRAVERLQPPPDSNRGRAGYVLGAPNQGLYMHQFANNAAEATQINMGFSEIMAVNLKNSGLVKTGVA